MMNKYIKGAKNIIKKVQLKIPKDILSDLLKWLLTTRDNKC
jgi:hypothetical protein